MKSLILKDLFNISHHTKSTLLTFLVLGVCLLPSSGAVAYLFMMVVLCCSMTLSTFTYDEASHWAGYALTMPVTRREVVQAKFGVLAIFTMMGVAVGLIGGVAGELLMGKQLPTVDEAQKLLCVVCLAFAFGMSIGGTSLPLVFRFGPEKVRMFIFAAALVPVGIVGGGVLLVKAAGIVVTETALMVLMLLSPVAALAWNAAMCAVSCRIFEGKDIG